MMSFFTRNGFCYGSVVFNGSFFFCFCSENERNGKLKGNQLFYADAILSSFLALFPERMAETICYTNIELPAGCNTHALIWYFQARPFLSPCFSQYVEKKKKGETQ